MSNAIHLYKFVDIIGIVLGNYWGMIGLDVGVLYSHTYGARVKIVRTNIGAIYLSNKHVIQGTFNVWSS